MNHVKIVFVVMVLITIVAGIVVAYAVATNDEEEIHRHCFEEICAHLLDEEPAKWIPENETLDLYVIHRLFKIVAQW